MPWILSVWALVLCTALYHRSSRDKLAITNDSAASSVLNLAMFPPSYGVLYHFAFLLPGFAAHGIRHRFLPSLEITHFFTGSATVIATTAVVFLGQDPELTALAVAMAFFSATAALLYLCTRWLSQECEGEHRVLALRTLQNPTFADFWH